jgi:hypothetical protein
VRPVNTRRHGEDYGLRMDTLVRVGGGAAILAGALRAAGSFASGGSEVERQSLYFIVDLLLLLGVFAAYAQNHEAVGRWGAAGFLTTVAGILLVRSSRAMPGLDLYPAGALLVAVGWVLLSLAWWRTANGPAFVPLLFGLSIVTGLLGQIVPRAPLFVASGAIFGAAVVGAGRQVLLAATAASRNEASRVAQSQPAENWQRHGARSTACLRQRRRDQP